MSEKLKILNWNLEGFSTQRRHDRRKLSHILSFDWDVLTVQELARSTHKLIAEEVEHSTDVSVNRDFNAAVYTRNDYRIDRQECMTRDVLPERAVAAQVTSPSGSQFTACSWHASHACEGKHFLKAAQYSAVVAFLNRRQEPILVGCDANSGCTGTNLMGNGYSASRSNAEEDMWQHAQNEFWSGNPSHSMRDAFLLYLKHNPAEYAKCCAQRPNGPLGLSYDTSRVLFNRTLFGKETNKSASYCCMDHILVSKHFDVAYCDYEFERAVTEGYSDHATIHAELSFVPVIAEQPKRSVDRVTAKAATPVPRDHVPKEDVKGKEDNRRFAGGTEYWEGLLNLLESEGLIENVRLSSNNRSHFDVVGWDAERFQARVCYLASHQPSRVCFLIKMNPSSYDVVMQSQPDLVRCMPLFGGWKTEDKTDKGAFKEGHICVDVVDVDATDRADFIRQQRACANAFRDFFEALDPIIQGLQREPVNA